jgi:four helix bundle protein
MGGSPVREKSYAFALRIVRLTRQLRERREYELARQVLRAGTSVGANVEEAQAGLSRRDFVAKMSVAAKEARESRYWLSLLEDSGICAGSDTRSMIDDATELIRILTAIVKTGSRKR